jgi:hypothetical protein
MNTLIRKYILILSLLALLVFLSCSQASPKKEAEMQVESKNHFGLLQGSVTDEDELPIPGANVFIRKLLIGTNADTLGNYLIHNIPAGTYNIEAITVGYDRVSIPNVVIEADSVTTLNISMKAYMLIFPNINIDKKTH